MNGGFAKCGPFEKGLVSTHCDNPSHPKQLFAVYIPSLIPGPEYSRAEKYIFFTFRTAFTYLSHN